MLILFLCSGWLVKNILNSGIIDYIYICIYTLHSNECLLTL